MKIEKPSVEDVKDQSREKKKIRWLRIIFQTLPVSIILAILIIPLFNEIRVTECEKANLNDLRETVARAQMYMFVEAAQQYMLDQGVTRVTYADIAGPDSRTSPQSVKSGNNTNLSELVLTPETTRLSVTLPDGKIVDYDF